MLNTLILLIALLILFDPVGWLVAWYAPDATPRRRARLTALVLAAPSVLVLLLGAVEIAAAGTWDVPRQLGADVLLQAIMYLAPIAGAWLVKRVGDFIKRKTDLDVTLLLDMLVGKAIDQAEQTARTMLKAGRTMTNEQKKLAASTWLKAQLRKRGLPGWAVDAADDLIEAAIAARRRASFAIIDPKKTPLHPSPSARDGICEDPTYCPGVAAP